jgi:tetratricopeptide (TPR) repeat protein
VDGWCQVTTPDFTVISQMSVPDTARWAGNLNQFLHALKGRVPVDPRLLGPFNLVLFKSDSDYWASAPVLKSGAPLSNIAAFGREGDWGSIAATCELGASEQTQRMIFETCVNWILSADHRYRPLALQTGLSEVYGAYVIENGSEIFGQPVRGWTSRLQRAENHVLGNAEVFLTPEELLSVNDMNAVADVHGVHLFYVESWGFTHFLLFSKEMANEHAMDRLLAAFAHHHNAHDALKEAFGDRADTLISRFRSYIQGGDFYEIALPIEPAPLPSPPLPADPALVASILGRLEATTGHLDIARAYAQQAIQLKPNDPRPRDALALVDFIAHLNVEASADCKEAIRLGSKDASTWLFSSLVAGKADGADKEPAEHALLSAEQAREAVNAAERAILFSKGLETAYVQVAALMPHVGRVSEDDGKFLALGRMLFPNDGWIEIGHAQWAHRVKDDPLALKILGDLLDHSAAYAPEEAERARTLQKKWSAPSG